MPDLECAYSLYGTDVSIGGDAEVTGGVHRRLGPFSVPGVPASSYRFEYARVASADQHTIPPAVAGSRLVYEFSDGEATYHSETAALHIRHGKRIRILCEPGRRRTRISVTELRDEDLWLLAYPLLTLPLIEVMRRRGRHHLHAAGLAVEGRGLVIPGTSGTGKSTLTTALVRAGFDLLSDDTLFLEVDHPRGEGGSARILGFPGPTRVTDETCGFFPELRGLRATPKLPGWNKHALYADATYGTRQVAECRPEVVVFAQYSGRARSVLKRVEPDEALIRLAPEVLLTEPRASQGHLDALSVLVRASRCYALETGRDFEALPGLLRELMARQ